MDFLSDDQRPEWLVVRVMGFPIIAEWCQLLPTFNLTPDLTRLILVNSARVYKDFKGRGWLKMIFQ
jgi:hypothetical protein